MTNKNYKSISSERDRANIALLKRYVNEIWNKQRIEIIEEFFSLDFISHYEYGDIKGINIWKEKHYEPLINAFSDLHVEVEDIIANGDCVVTRWEAQAVHTGEIFGVPPTGTKIKLSGMVWSKVIGGKIIELWNNWNLSYLVQYLLKEVKTLRGLLPICSSCKKIKDDNGYWHVMEIYIREHSEADFSQTICPECTKNLSSEPQ